MQTKNVRQNLLETSQNAAFSSESSYLTEDILY